MLNASDYKDKVYKGATKYLKDSEVPNITNELITAEELLDGKAFRDVKDL